MSKANEAIQNVPYSIEKIIQGMPEISYAISKKGSLLTWNKKLELLFGYSKDELHFKFMQEFIYQPDKERVLKKFMEIANENSNEDRTIEYRVITKYGKIIPILAIRSLVYMEGAEFIIGIAINTSKLSKKKLKLRLDAIIHLKNQLSDYYQVIEKMNQAEIKLNEKIFLNAKNFNAKLINNLPGIFYLYEKIGEQFLLKKWNKNYTIDLGYPDDELLNMQPHKFFTEKEYKKAEKAIQQIFTTGSTQVEIYTNHKNGKQIPYFYQGYHFEDKGKTYFMGVGIDISIRYALEKKQKRDEIEKIKAKNLSDANKRELISTALEISKSNRLIKFTLKQIDELLEKHSDSKISKDLKHIKNNLKSRSAEQDNWEVFKLRFREMHKGFFSTLKAKHPELTKSELKFSAYLRIHLSSSQISAVLNVTKEAIKKTRYRIRKKLNLSPKDSLENYIDKF